MKLLVLAVGKLKEPWVRQGCAEYEQRIARHLPYECLELRDEAALERRWPPRYHVIALDERGREPTTVELAERLRQWTSGGIQGVAFLLGGADGHSPAVLARADEKMALSRLTLPHRLARLLLVEQLYRALSLLRGEPYHRA